MVEGGLVDGSALTVTGRAAGRGGRERRGDARASRSSPTAEQPFKASGGIKILRGNLAPDGAVVKIAGHEPTRLVGRARVFDREEDAMRELDARTHRRRATSW